MIGVDGQSFVSFWIIEELISRIVMIHVNRIIIVNGKGFVVELSRIVRVEK